MSLIFLHVIIVVTALVEKLPCGFPFIFMICLLSIHKGKGTKIKDRDPWMTLKSMEVTFQKMTSVNQLSFIPEYRKYI